MYDVEKNGWNGLDNIVVKREDYPQVGFWTSPGLKTEGKIQQAYLEKFGVDAIDNPDRVIKKKSLFKKRGK
jgi:hypothetical protein